MKNKSFLRMLTEIIAVFFILFAFHLEAKTILKKRKISAGNSEKQQEKEHEEDSILTPEPDSGKNPLSTWDLSIPELERAKKAFETGGEENAVSQLQLAMSKNPDSKPIKTALVDLINLQCDHMMEISHQRKAGNETLEIIEQKLSIARELDENRMDTWRAYLSLLSEIPGQKQRFLEESRTLFVKHWAVLASETVTPWVDLLKKLEVEFSANDQPIFQHEVVDMLSRNPETYFNAAETQTSLRSRIRQRMIDYTCEIEDSIKSGKLVDVEFLLFALFKVAPDSLPLRSAFSSFNREKSLRQFLSLASQAIQDGDLRKARQWIQAGKQIEPEDNRLISMQASLKMTLAPEEQKSSGSASGSEVPDGDQKKKILEEIEAAEKEDDIAILIQLLNKLREMDLAEPKQIAQLEHLQFEVINSRKVADETMERARGFLKNQDWEALRRLFNRNPFLLNDPMDPQRTADCAEMMMAAKFYCGKYREKAILDEGYRLLGLKPDSFYVPLIQLEIVLKNEEYGKVPILLEKLEKKNPQHPTIIKARQLIKSQKSRTLTHAILVVAALIFLGFSVPILIRMWQSLTFDLMTRISDRFPKWSIARMEASLEDFEDPEKYRELLELLTSTCFKIHDFDRGQKYGEMLRKINPRNPIAREHLGKYYLTLSNMDERKTEAVAAYLNVHKKERNVMTEYGRYISRSKDLKPHQAPLIEVYLNEFPQDIEMLKILREGYQKMPFHEIGPGGSMVMEKVWRLNSDNSLLPRIWQAYAAAGLFEQAKRITEEAKKSDVPVEGKLLIPDIDSANLESCRKSRTGLQETKGETRAEILRQLLKMNYFHPDASRELLEVVEQLYSENNPAIRYHLEKARSHLKDIAAKTQAFRSSLGITDVVPVEVKPEEKPAPVEPVKAEPHKIINVPEAIQNLPLQPRFNQIVDLTKESTEADVPVWTAYLDRQGIPPTTIALVLKFIGVIKSPKVTELILKYFNHLHPRVKANLIEGLEENNDPAAIPHLMKLVTDADNRIRANAVKALISFGVSEAVTHLKKMVDDTDVRFRDSAMYILRSFKRPEFAESLKKFLNDHDPMIRKKAIQALADQGIESNFEVLEKLSSEVLPMEERETLDKVLADHKKSRTDKHLPDKALGNMPLPPT